MTRRPLLLGLLITVGTQVGGAQITSRRPTLPVQSDSTAASNAGCPSGNGIQISTTAGTGTDSASASNTLIGIGQSVDTTLVFDITRKTWTRSNIAAAITVGLADQSRGTYWVCAGISALLPSATLSISGARGRVHFAASLADFQNSLRRPSP